MKTSRAAVDEFLAKRAIAIVGASRSGRKFGNIAMRELKARGYRVYPIHPIAAEIDSVPCYSGFSKLPEKVDALLVVVPPIAALDVIRDAAQAGLHYVWLQQGSESKDVVALCHELHLVAIAGECILMFAQPKGVHKFHRWIWGALGKLPAH